MLSNISADRRRLCVGGARALAVLGARPPIDGDRLQHFVTAGTDSDPILTVTADPEAMPDLLHYLELIAESVSELKEAARAVCAGRVGQGAATRGGEETGEFPGILDSCPVRVTKTRTGRRYLDYLSITVE